ncbi:usherin [Brachionus plicatilis]|uniref:Usherin n=1 Tax=Brachionus plicatilis TaxID=10195 RepID=A0A3M7SQ13_BRAPC|nr:usherin [Brachionus plicatilis]
MHNTVILYGEIYRKSKKFASEHTEEILVKNFTLPTPVIDCLLTPNVLYSYRSVIYNSVGSVSSEYTELVPIDLLKPENFKQMTASQINETLIRLTFSKPSTYSQHVNYKIYRDSNLIATLYQQTSDLLSYDDFFVFAPDQYLKYNVFACNQIGCSSDDKFSVFVKTRNLPPVLVYKPILLDLGSDYIKIDASLSVVLRVNQKILEYRYFLNNVMTLATTEPVVLIKNLKPNTQYLINLEVCTFLGPGCLKSSDYLQVQTLQILPVIDFDPTCEPGMRNLTIKWPTTPQHIDNYVIKYRLGQDQYSNLLVKDKNWVYIDKLKPFSDYEIVLGGCNRAGCSYSQNFVCKTTGKLSNVTIQVETTADGFLFVWNIDHDLKDQDLEFKLFRSVLNQPILYDQKFRPIRLQDKVVYAGTDFGHEDQAVNFDTEYLYHVEMTSMYGVVKSESLRLRTKAAAPQLLVMIGSIRHVGNDSVSLVIRPPLKVNGRLEGIYVLVKLNGFEVAKEMVHENLAGLDGEQLVEFLSNVTVDGLAADSVYELKTKFCNQVSCLISLQTIKFKTLSNERIDFFDAMWRVDKTIVFKWDFKKVSTRSIREKISFFLSSYFTCYVNSY